MKRIAFFVALAWLLVCSLPALTAEQQRDATFLATSDCHYKAGEAKNFNKRDHDTLAQMNSIAQTPWPEKLGGDAIAQPRGVVVLGDIIDDGDRKGVSAEQWAGFTTDFGLDGTDGFLKYRVFEGWGNHDGPPQGKEKNGFSMQGELKKRNALRKEKGWLTNLSENGLHYSWDWDDVHFVQLNLYPADKLRDGVKYSPVWHDPQGSLSFLKQDLAKHVAASGRPVVLLSHCGFDTDWWNADDWKEVHAAAKPYNVILYMYGHTGTGVRDWAPAGETKPFHCVNTGQTEKGFFVVQIKGSRVRLAYRIKAKGSADAAEPKWEWAHLKEFDISAAVKP